MTKFLINWSLIIVVNVFFSNIVFAQQKLIGDSDYRIDKFYNDMVRYSVSDRNSDSGMLHKIIERNELSIFVKKCLEIYSDTTNSRLLLVEFGIAGDDAPRFWGILSDNERYFFSDSDDLSETELSMFKKRYDHITVGTILHYCYLNPLEEIGIFPEAYAIYRKNLSIIKDALHCNDKLRFAKIDSAKSFLENLTNIKLTTIPISRTKYHLTPEDYTKWLNWLNENSKKLYWNVDKQRVQVKW